MSVHMSGGAEAVKAAAPDLTTPEPVSPEQAMPPHAAARTRADATTDGTLLGGRVPYRQFRDGYRTGLEPVLLAAAVPARPGEQVLEAGCGAGAGLLCLAARLPEVRLAGIERDAGTARLARFNLDRNGRPDVPVEIGDLEAEPPPSDGALFHHAIANPPWHRASATHSPDARRDLARRLPDGALTRWTHGLARRLRPRGTLTLALPAALHAEAAASLLANGFGAVHLLPLWPVPGRPARLVMMQAVKEGRGDAVLLPGLVLHCPGGGFTEEAEAILRGGARLPMTAR